MSDAYTDSHRHTDKRNKVVLCSVCRRDAAFAPRFDGNGHLTLCASHGDDDFQASLESMKNDAVCT